MPEPLTRVPMAIVRGNTVAWRVSYADFNPADGWALTYAFEGPSQFDTVAAVDGDGFLVELSSLLTTTPVGWYRWQATATRSTPVAERVLVAAGQTEILEDLGLVSGLGEQKSHARRMVEALEAQLEGRATDGQKSMSINGRSLERIPVLELMEILSKYRMQLRAEEAAEAQGAKPGKRRRIQVRF